jgi:2',3'-cyclic-nucleotide 2'-phosphodiesterase (5'-nucleotidase family)
MNHSPVQVVSRFTCLALATIVGLACLTACSQPAPKPGHPSPLASPAKSPVASPAVTLPPASFQLTVLHTNDTWGYLFPCG